ncbi:2-succinyl-5-enolpyruvyl-6-hydroxy-3-cyclohexene-1-carboxylic-acid synthase [Salinithrix halophila]|uniref:2-succinyl-5-enolpyruvyl-6-hydroxy-3-cyclohexene-1-carboxylate synthase n=1 Tax=Salinithrix halophila TaxID=1485204 RepID=A0ABV8JDP1_9BACL
MSTHREELTAYTGAFVDELVKGGLTQAVISPGSRSTPLAMVMVAHPDLTVRMHVDERSAGFFALGLAKTTGKPTALLCTSGTAAANYAPAVVEARLARVPLVVLTSDRPHELRDVGAPQAIDQLGMYGSHAKWFAEMALPESSEPMLRYVRTMAARAVGTASVGPKGPVHLNFPFREPLVPDLQTPSLFKGGRRSGETGPYVTVSEGRRKPDGAEVDRLAAAFAGVERGLIVCGPQEDPSLGGALHRLAESLSWPVLADPLSQLRRGPHAADWILDSYDAFLRHPIVKEKAAPEAVIRFGAMPVSKPWMLFMKERPDCRQVVVDPDGGWREPTLSATEMIYADPALFAEELAGRVESLAPIRTGRWANAWRELDARTRKEMDAASRKVQGLFEGRVFTELAETMPEGSLLFAGNSMPIRDMDSFFLKGRQSVRTMANRGANGIDGVVSTALGAAAHHPRTVLVLGDLSFYHDLNGLLAAKMHRLDLTIIVVNNDGGGIFSFLPQAAELDKENFETLFGTPVDLDYAHAVHMYGGAFTRVASWEAFRSAFREGMEGEGLHVIEVPTSRNENAALHRQIWSEVHRSLDSWLAEVDFGWIGRSAE